uniref:SWIM-type domain-containing protein n=1 Tax=Panagrolaimus davidi TaxID=227884 RepID=A0A914Q8W0_9BILA
MQDMVGVVPKSEILELPNPEDYASNIKEKRKVILNGPEISVDVFDGEENYARKFVAATIINSCSITNLGNGKFWVEDSKGSFAVEKRDRNVLKCQCNTAKSCVHIGAVKLLSGEEATFGRAQDPVKTNNAFLQKYETKSGRKRPRLIDTPAAAAAEVEESGDDEREMASVDHSLEDWLKNGKVVAEKDSVLSSPSAVEKKVQERDNIRSMFCES